MGLLHTQKSSKSLQRAEHDFPSKLNVTAEEDEESLTELKRKFELDRHIQ